MSYSTELCQSNFFKNNIYSYPLKHTEKKTKQTSKLRFESLFKTNSDSLGDSGAKYTFGCSCSSSTGVSEALKTVYHFCALCILNTCHAQIFQVSEEALFSIKYFYKIVFNTLMSKFTNLSSFVFQKRNMSHNLRFM